MQFDWWWLFCSAAIRILSAHDPIRCDGERGWREGVRQGDRLRELLWYYIRNWDAGGYHHHFCNSTSTPRGLQWVSQLTSAILHRDSRQNCFVICWDLACIVSRIYMMFLWKIFASASVLHYTCTTILPASCFRIHIILWVRTNRIWFDHEQLRACMCVYVYVWVRCCGFGTHVVLLFMLNREFR